MQEAHLGIKDEKGHNVTVETDTGTKLVDGDKMRSKDFVPPLVEKYGLKDAD